MRRKKEERGEERKQEKERETRKIIIFQAFESPEQLAAGYSRGQTV